MWVIGVILLILGLVFHSSLLFLIGFVVLIVGVAMFIVAGRNGPHRWYW